MSGWFQWMALHNPLSWMIDGARRLVIYGFDWSDAFQALVVPGVISVFTIALAVHADAAPGAGPVTGRRRATSAARRERGARRPPWSGGTRSGPAQPGQHRPHAVRGGAHPSPCRCSSSWFQRRLSALTDIPGFPTDNALNWFMPHGRSCRAPPSPDGHLLRDRPHLENGFYDRLLMAPRTGPAWSSGR